MKLWKEYHTTRNELTLYFKSDRRSRYDNFDITITRYHTGNLKFLELECILKGFENASLVLLARLHEVHTCRAIAVTPVVHVPVPVRVRVTLALEFSRSPFLDNHSSESIHTWTIDTL